MKTMPTTNGQMMKKGDSGDNNGDNAGIHRHLVLANGGFLLLNECATSTKRVCVCVLYDAVWSSLHTISHHHIIYLYCIGNKTKRIGKFLRGLDSKLVFSFYENQPPIAFIILFYFPCSRSRASYMLLIILQCDAITFTDIAISSIGLAYSACAFCSYYC